MNNLGKVQLQYMYAKDILERVCQAEAEREKYPIEYIETLSDFIQVCEDMGVQNTFRGN